MRNPITTYYAHVKCNLRKVKMYTNDFGYISFFYTNLMDVVDKLKIADRIY